MTHQKASLSFVHTQTFKLSLLICKLYVSNGQLEKQLIQFMLVNIGVLHTLPAQNLNKVCTLAARVQTKRELPKREVCGWDLITGGRQKLWLRTALEMWKKRIDGHTGICPQREKGQTINDEYHFHVSWKAMNINVQKFLCK